MNIFIELFLTFSKIGLFTFGGGYAMISIIENHCVEVKKWITHDEMMDITVIAESTPGPIAINCATYVGYKQAGILGAVIASLGIILPSFIVIFIISMFLNDFLEIKMIASAFQGIKVAVGILIFNAGINMMKKIKRKRKSYMIMICSFFIMFLNTIFSWNFSSMSLMIIVGILSLILFIIEEQRQKSGVEL